MNRQITKLALLGIALLTALIVATTYWQTWASAGLADRQDNEIQRVAQFSIKRGLIRASDGTILASNRVRYLFRFSAVTRNFPPASMPVQYHQDRCRSQPRNILVSVHCT